MAKEKEVKEPEAKVEEAPKPEAEVAEAEKPQPELEQLRTELQKMEGRYQSVSGQVRKYQEEIQSLKDDRELWKAMIATIAEQRGVSEEQAEQYVQQRKPNLAQQFDLQQRRLEQKRLAAKMTEYRNTVERELGLNPSDEDYKIIQGLVVTGQFADADKRIEALKGNKAESQPTSEKKETEEERDKRIRDDERRKVLEEHSLLEPESGEPSAAASKKREDVIARYARGEATDEEYLEATKK